MLSYLICGLALLLRVFSSLYSINNNNSHKSMSTSSISKSLSNERTTRQQSEEKLSKIPSLPLNISESYQTQIEDYRGYNARGFSSGFASLELA